MTDITLAPETLAARIPALLRMPVYFNGLVMENTNRCNSKCAICYQSAGGNTPAERLNVEKAVSVIEQAAILENIGNRFHLAGGEAFLYPEDCFRLFQAAQDNGFFEITTTTNGFWGATIQNARRICSRMRESGVTSLELSWDIWHSEFISNQAIENCLFACRENEITVNLRLLTTKSHNMEEALSMLCDQAIQCAQVITCGPVFATGRAAEVLKQEEFYDSRSGLTDSCFSILNLTVGVNGDVFPCCAGLDMCQNASFGNIYEQSLYDIVSKMNLSPILRQLVFLGPASFLPQIKKRGIKLEETYFSICQLCRSIFSNSECFSAIREDAGRRQLKALEEIAASLNATASEQGGMQGG